MKRKEFKSRRKLIHFEQRKCPFILMTKQSVDWFNRTNEKKYFNRP